MAVWDVVMLVNRVVDGCMGCCDVGKYGGRWLYGML